jgi:CMP-N,N'-diacetyllegionaminic acid synthase
MKQKELLFIIPARGGSKGIPEKNIKPLHGKPLIHYSIELARQFVPDNQICVSTDDMRIANCVRSINLEPPFTRPAHLATDTSGTYETLVHAIDFYKSQGRFFSTIVLLQPTSPFRKAEQLKQMLEMYKPDLEMLVSVKESNEIPYYNMYEEDEVGYLKLSKSSSYVTRQECPSIYTYNGAFYIINTNALLKTPLHKFTKIRKYVMDDISSTDLDTIFDWQWAEFLLERELV